MPSAVSSFRDTPIKGHNPKNLLNTKLFTRMVLSKIKPISFISITTLSCVFFKFDANKEYAQNNFFKWVTLIVGCHDWQSSKDSRYAARVILCSFLICLTRYETSVLRGDKLKKQLRKTAIIIQRKTYVQITDWNLH
jgi:hypothetical protein